MGHQEACIFCQIAEGKIPAKKVLENEEFVAFYDIHPEAPIHVLVIPRHHITCLSECTEMDEPWLGRMISFINQVTRVLGCAYSGGDSGFRTIINSGPGGGQEVYHLHAHILSGEGNWKKRPSDR